jgi:AhpD family alkylhydroperoxidase
MTNRLNMPELVPAGYTAVLGLEKYVTANVDHTVLHLIKLRASILNGCSFCVDMHSRDALAAGEDSRRLFGVGAWHESPLYTERERAALALTDEVTRLGAHGVSDEVFDQARAVWSAEEVANLILAIVTINVWNRIAITTRKEPPKTA